MLDTGERCLTTHFNLAWNDHKERYHFALNFVKENSIILDAACGSGYGSYYLAELSPCKSVVAVDYDPEAIKWAQIHFPSPKISYINLNLDSEFLSFLPFQQFDLITSFVTLEHLDNDVRFLRTCFDLLAADGILLLAVPNINVMPVELNKFHKRHYDPSLLSILLSDLGFYIIAIYTQQQAYMIKGHSGPIFTVVASKHNYSPIQINDLDEIIESCQLLIQEDNPIFRNINKLNISSCFTEILLAYSHLSEAIEQINAGNYNMALEFLSLVSSPKSIDELKLRLLNQLNL